MIAGSVVSVLVTLCAGTAFGGLYAVGLQRDGDTLSPFSIVTCWYVYFFYVPYLAVVYGGVNIWDLRNVVFIANLAMLHILFSYTVFALCYLQTNTVVRFSRLWQRDMSLTLTPLRAKIGGIGLYALGLFSWVTFVELNGGFGALLAANDIWQFRQALGSLRYWILLQVGFLGGLGLYIGGNWYDGTTRNRFLVYALCGLTGFIFVVSHTRTRALAPILFLILYYHYNVRELQIRHLAVLGIVGAAFVGLFGPLEQFLHSGTFAFNFNWLEKGLYNYFFHNYMGLIATVPSSIEHAWGRAFNTVPWIRIWPFTQLRALMIDYATVVEISVKGRDLLNVGESAAGIGKWYFNFGLLGVGAVSGLLGFSTRLFYLYWQSQDEMIVSTGIYLLLFHYFYFVFAGDLFSYIHYVVLVPLVLLVIVFR